MPTIKVPASTANMGSGFDAIGMALTMYNEVYFEEGGNGLEITIQGDDAPVPLDDTNLVVRSMNEVLSMTGVPQPHLRIVQTNRIPQTRGLGSSSACVVAGIIMGNILCGGELSTDQMVTIAARIEGHPDNILPAFMGGMTAGAIEDGVVRYVHIDPPKQLKACVMIPDFELSTKKARDILPLTVAHKDAIFNASRAALMVGAMTQGRMDLVRVALGDRLHQPYRKQLIPDYDRVVECAEKAGALGCCLSGAGPTMIAFLDRDYRQFVQRMKIAAASFECAWRVELLDVCREGATWEI